MSHLQFQRSFVPNSYRLCLPLRYQSRGFKGTGTTLALATTRMAFVPSQDHLVVGEPIEISLDWPALLHGKTLLQLVVKGKIEKCGPGMAEVLITRHDFRTRRKEAAA